MVVKGRFAVINMERNLQDLAHCLKEAGKIVDRLSSDRDNSRPGTSTSSQQSSLQSAMLSVSSTVQRARSMVQSSASNYLVEIGHAANDNRYHRDIIDMKITHVSSFTLTVYEY